MCNELKCAIQSTTQTHFPDSSGFYIKRKITRLVWHYKHTHTHTHTHTHCWDILCSSRLHLFDQKYRTVIMWNIIKKIK